MSYEEAVAYLDALGVDAMRSTTPTLHRIRALCDLLDHPERRAPAVHVTGTNGKTSVARIATALLRATGLSVGTYTSPHLGSVRERIALGGDPIAEDDFTEAFEHLRPFIAAVEDSCGEALTYFEILTALFFLWAAEAPVDVMVVEVGLGGRWDATNVVEASVAAITNIDLDHTDLMGADRAAIAREKAGIVKPAATLVTAERVPSLLEILKEEAATASEVVVLGEDFALERNDVAVGGRHLDIRSSAGLYDGLYLPLHGAHQGVNAAVALEAVTRSLAKPLAPEVVAEGFAAASVPGRLEVVRPATETAPAVLCDVAHNPAGMSAVVSSVIEAFVFTRAVVVIGVLSDKDHVGMLTELSRLPCSLVTTEARSERSLPAEDLARAAADLGLPAVAVAGLEPAIARALSDAGPGDLVLVAGSHYVVGEARALLR